MKHNFKKFAVAIAAIMTISSVTLVSCDKEDSTSGMNRISPSKNGLTIPHFNSRHEVEAAIDSAISFDTITDLVAFEKKQGRNSIGAISDVFYENINTNSFQNETDVLVFFQIHQDVLDTIMENDEVAIMPKWSNTPYRYVANAIGMFAVGERYYKLFKTGTVSTTDDYVGELAAMTDDDLDNIDTSVFRYIPDEEKNFNTYGCIKKWKQSNSPNSINDRIHIVLVTHTQTWPSAGDVAVTRVKVYNLHKEAGIWWTNRHNLSCEGSVNLHIKTMDCSDWEYIERSFEKHQKANVMWVPVYVQPCYWTCVDRWDILFNRYCKYYHYNGFRIDAWYPGHAVESFIS